MKRHRRIRVTDPPEIWGLQQPPWVVAMKGRHAGRRAFILGNGPSLLQQVDLLPRLQSEITLTVNRFARWTKAGFIPKYHATQTFEVCKHAIKDGIYVVRMVGGHEDEDYIPPEWNTVKLLFADRWRGVGDRAEEHGWLWVSKADPHAQVKDFGFHALKHFLPPFPDAGCIPLTAAQILAWMGIAEFYFLGIDCAQGYVYNPTEQRPQPALDDLKVSFARARKDIEAAGRRIYDCTPGGRMNALGVLEYVPLEKVLDRAREPVEGGVPLLKAM